MTRRLLAFFAPGLLMLAGCADQTSRFHNHGTPEKPHLKAKPQMFTVDTDKGNDFTVLRQSDDSVKLIQRGGKSVSVLNPDPQAKKPTPKPKPLGDMDITPDDVDPDFHGFPMQPRTAKVEMFCAAHTPRDCPAPPSIPRPRNGQCPVCGTMAYPYHEGSSSTQDAYYPWPGSRRLTICAHCNATFRQWAEGKEPKR